MITYFVITRKFDPKKRFLQALLFNLHCTHYILESTYVKTELFLRQISNRKHPPTPTTTGYNAKYIIAEV